MLPDLERLIRLQQLDNATTEAQRTVDAMPSRIEALDARLANSSAAVEAAKTRLADKKGERQAVEKSLGEVQTRLSRFNEQLMAVKTNKEYTAMQHEIATARTEVQRLEDDILEHMLAGDDLAADVEAAERVLQTERTEVERERSALDTERSVLERTLHGTSDERAKLTGSIGAAAQRLFELVSSQRSGIAVVEARDGHCSLCNVRLRPQMFNQILQGTELIQCESCMRILYHDPNGGGARSTAPGPSR
jgi:predicted  nucleic acid-binding Zn-ribbon protein|tara:strand:+ start:145 stop:891 length:747 start_codon:yes stop_codon:yes gene_type:complete